MAGRSFDIEMLVAKLRQRLCNSPAANWLPVDDLVQECVAHLQELGWLDGHQPLSMLLYRADRRADEVALQAKAWRERHLLFTDVFKPEAF